jgi:7-carboxy-7-deazaguanine synthase
MKQMQETEIETGVDCLPLMESFYTLQGEGYHQGKAAYFIRLAGCDVGCPWCDVKASWVKSPEQYKEVRELVDLAKHHPGRLAVITGGEPTLYRLDSLTRALKMEGFRTHIETSGAYPLSGTWDWICLSPKKFKPPLDEVIQNANELKIVIYNKSDFQWAETYGSKVPASSKLYLQPEWSRASAMTPSIVEFIKAHPRWELSLQIHKYIQVP